MKRKGAAEIVAVVILVVIAIAISIYVGSSSVSTTKLLNEKAQETISIGK